MIPYNPDYFDLDWQLWRNVYTSGRHFVDTYLEHFNTRETRTQFEQRRKLTPCPAYAKSAIMEVVNNIFQRMPDITRIDGSSSYMNCLDGLEGGVDLIGSSMNYFIGMSILPELLVMRKVGVYIDMPDADGLTLLDVKTNNIRPYLYSYCAEEIVNWQLDFNNNMNEFSSVLLREDYPVLDSIWGLPSHYVQRYRFMFIGDDGFVHIRYHDNDGELIEDEVILKINKIPFVIFEIPHSLLSDAARYQVAILNMNSSDINYCLYSNFPFYTEQQDNRASSAFTKDSPDATIKTGLSTGRGYPIGTERPEFIAPPTEPLKASMAKQDQLELAIRKLINLAIIQLGQVQASAESKQLDSQGLEAGLSAIGIALERGERKIAEYWAMYENSSVATVHYPLRYSLKSDSERRSEATDLTKLAQQFPSQTMRKEVVKLAARTLIGPKVSKLTLMTIEDEIDSSEIVVTDPTEIVELVTAGILDKKNAAKALILPENAVELANTEHAQRLAIISQSQSANKNELPNANELPNQARGNTDGNPAPEKELAIQTSPDPIPTRGKGK